MAAVTQLGYVGFRARDLAAWRRLATGVFGFEVVEPEPGGPLYLRIDERHHRIALYPAGDDALDHIGWEAADAAAFAALVERIAAAGIAVAPGTADERALRQVRELARFRDPNGFPVEIYCGARRETRPLLPSRPTAGFKAGALGLGHVVLRCADPEASVGFYRDVLGMRVTDTADLPRMSATFLHCNPRHHSLALTTALPGAAGTVSHVMVEALALEDVGRAYELCLADEVPIWLTLGQHTNDRVLSFYARSPSGFGLEYGWGGLEIDDADWRVEHWTTGSFWGHKPAA